ncbi:MAG: sulfatase [Deltaproteobacteria bacterium]
MRRWGPLAALALAACAKTSSPANDGPQSRRSVLLITIDTLRADHLPTYGYFRNTAPNLDAFANEAIVFENVATPMATTLPAHTSIMTGTPPRRHEIVRNGLVFESEPDLRLVAEVFEKSGYQTAAVVSASPVADGTGISSGFQHYDDPKDGPRPGAITADLAMTQFERFDDRPFFMWVHFWDPHDPYEPPAPYDEKYDKKDGIEDFVKKTGTKLEHRIGNVRFDVLEINNLYDGEIAYMDEHLGRLLDAIKRTGRYEETTVVITADHGEGLWQHDWHDHGRIYNEEILVPLIIKPPASLELAAARNVRMATTIDIFPTLGRLLDLPFDDALYRQFEGIDLFDGRVIRPYVLSERVHRHREGWEKGDKLAITGLDYKLFRLSSGPDQLFDLRDDPFELKDIADIQPDARLKMARYYNGTLANYAAAQRKVRKDVSPELVEKLRTLGYVQ